MLFGDRVVDAENNYKVSINKTKLLPHVIIIKPIGFQGTIKVHSPLEKQEEIWSESHLAVACGTVTGDNICFAGPQ